MARGPRKMENNSQFMKVIGSRTVSWVWRWLLKRNNEAQCVLCQRVMLKTTDSPQFSPPQESSVKFHDMVHTEIKQHVAGLRVRQTFARHLSKAHIDSTNSVQPEREFSTMSSFCTKIRSRLSSNFLNALLFLRSYFKSNMKK